MSVQLHAYRPAIGIGIAQNGEEWLLANIDQGQPRLSPITLADVKDLTARLGLNRFQKTFASAKQLIDFLMREYVLANKTYVANDSANDLDDDLDYLGRDLVIDWLKDMNHRLEVNDLEGIDGPTVLRHLDIMARNSSIETDGEMLALLVPLRNAWADRLELSGEVQEGGNLHPDTLEQRFPHLNGTTLKRHAELQQFAVVR